ncbi:MAG: histidine kinase [Pseudomonadales bacterium]|nr:histidine kinase [Halieaceae bacterium]MCP5189466.1 histidine kinase [Pseudomonadales bacterium]
MQAAPEQVAQAGWKAASGECLIPDLCAPRSVLTMVLLVELMVLVFTLSSSSLVAFNWDLLAVCSLFGQWVVLLSAAVMCALRRPLNRLRMPLAACCCLLVVMVTTALSSIAARAALPILFADSGDTGWWLLRNLLVAAVLAGIVLRYFYLQQQLQLQQKMELLARLDALRARIRPHFLFNTLNSIASLIMSRPAEAERVVEDLAELMRVSLQDGRRDATVADELRICELYLGIEQLRLGERLQLDWQIDPAVREKPMPSLLLQPLVENAVYHGVAQLPAGGTVAIRVAEDAGRVSIVVENPAPQQAARSAGHRIALENIGQRLHALYGSAGRLQIERPAGGYRVELSYPLQDAA